MSRPNEPPLPEPLAYFLTWTTYGTWLPGDERGWVRHYGGWRQADSTRELQAKSKMIEAPCILDGNQRRIVEDTIREHCQIRNWPLHALNCRTNHVHVVVTARIPPETVQSQFKAWCTRRLNEFELNQQEVCLRKQWWSERASRRWINDEASLEAAILYVRDGQDFSKKQ